jgi:hypothetical protein
MCKDWDDKLLLAKWGANNGNFSEKGKKVCKFILREFSRLLCPQKNIATFP